MSYAAYTPMVQAGQRRPALWRLFLGVVTAILGTALWLLALLLVLSFTTGLSLLDAARSAFSGSADTPERTILYLMVVAGLGFGTVAAAALWQKRQRRDLVGRGPRVLRHFAIAAGTTLTLAAVLSGVQAIFSSDPAPVRNLDLAVWLSWLPIALLALAFQTGAEELFFRGYLQSQLAARFRSPMVWLLVPSIAFGFAHFAPGLPGANSWLYVAFAATFGLLAGDLTARTGSLGAAWGWHFANNTFAVLVVSTEGSVTGLGFWRVTGGLTEPIPVSLWLLVDLTIILGVWFLLRRLLRV